MLIEFVINYVGYQNVSDDFDLVEGIECVMKMIWGCFGNVDL